MVILKPRLPSSGRRATLAAEQFVKFGGVLKHDGFVSSLGALISRRHLLSLVQRGRRSGA